MKIREGMLVRYRCRACKTPDVGEDLYGYSNYPRERRMQPLWRPAWVTRDWGATDGLPCVNLRVMTDSGGLEDMWRCSVPHVSHAAGTQQAWDFFDS